MKNTNINLGIDLGGTKIEIAALDFSTNNIIYRHRIPSPQNVYKDTLQAISDLIFETEQKTGFRVPSWYWYSGFNIFIVLQSEKCKFNLVK